MKKNLRQIITLSALVALLMSACSESSDSTGAAENDTVEINESSSSEDSSTSSNAENTATSKDEKESSSSEGSADSSSESNANSSATSDAESSDGDATSSSDASTTSSSETEANSSNDSVAESVTSSSGETTTVSSSETQATSSNTTTSSNDAAAASSSSAETIASSSSATQSNSSEGPTSSEATSSSIAELSEACKALRTTQSEFIPLENIFECVLPNEKVAILIRHAERDKDDNTGTKDLNDNGRDQSTYLGKLLKPLELEDFYYMSTDVNRTLTTAILISRGKNENVLDSLTVTQNTTSNHFVKNDDFTVSWFQKDKSADNCAGLKSWTRFTKMAYDKTACPDAFYDVDEKVEEIVGKHFKYKNINKYTLVATHDNFLAPFLISVTDRKIGLNAHDYVYTDSEGKQNNWNQNVFKHWPNYLAGAAIIINEKDERTYVPVKGLKTGYLGEHCPNNENEDGLYTCNKWEKDVK